MMSFTPPSAWRGRLNTGHWQKVRQAAVVVTGCCRSPLPPGRLATRQVRQRPRWSYARVASLSHRNKHDCNPAGFKCLIMSHPVGVCVTVPVRHEGSRVVVRAAHNGAYLVIAQVVAHGQCLRCGVREYRQAMAGYAKWYCRFGTAPAGCRSRYASHRSPAQYVTDRQPGQGHLHSCNFNNWTGPWAGKFSRSFYAR